MAGNVPLCERKDCTVTDISIMLEGQDGLNWSNFQRLARAVEDLGFASLHRSDHFVNARPPDVDSLPLWPSLTWLATHTQRIEFGPLVTPMSFRHPVHTARTGAAVDDLSGGRLWLGVGAGWNEREHQNYGFPLLGVKERFDRFRDGLEVITRLLRSDEHVSYQSREAVERGEAYYYLEDAILLPRPQRPGGPPILIGGNGPKLTLPLVAEYADIWNAVFASPQTFAERNRQLDEMLEARGRQPSDVRRTAMVGLIFGRDERQYRERLGSRDESKLLERGVLWGTASRIVDQIAEYVSAGAECIMIQYLYLDDLDSLEALADAVIGKV